MNDVSVQIVDILSRKRMHENNWSRQISRWQKYFNNMTWKLCKYTNVVYDQFTVQAILPYYFLYYHDALFALLPVVFSLSCWWIFIQHGFPASPPNNESLANQFVIDIVFWLALSISRARNRLISQSFFYNSYEQNILHLATNTYYC